MLEVRKQDNEKKGRTRRLANPRPEEPGRSELPKAISGQARTFSAPTCSRPTEGACNGLTPSRVLQFPAGRSIIRTREDLCKLTRASSPSAGAGQRAWKPHQLVAPASSSADRRTSPAAAGGQGAPAPLALPGTPRDAPTSGATRRGGAPLRLLRGSLGGPRARHSAPIWTIPAPADGSTYTRAEAARIAGVSQATLAGWVSRGLHGVRLLALRHPRGRILPDAFCPFLSSVNAVQVVMGGRCCASSGPPWEAPGPSLGGDHHGPSPAETVVSEVSASV